MKKMNKKVSALLIAFFSLFSVEINSVEKASTANEQTISSIVLRNGWLYFISIDGEEISRERIADIRSIVFLSDHSGPTDIIDVQEGKIRISPNPVQETLFVENSSETAYRIYDLDGRCLISGDGNVINVSPLTKGTYLLQINNNTLKFIKQ